MWIRERDVAAERQAPRAEQSKIVAGGGNSLDDLGNWQSLAVLCKSRDQGKMATILHEGSQLSYQLLETK